MKSTLSIGLLALFIVSGCRTPLPESPVPASLASPQAGYYLMESETFYKGLTYVAPSSEKLFTVYLLEKRGGQFGLKKGRNGKFEIVKDQVSIDKIKRSLVGKAELGTDGIFRGFAIVRITNMGIISRDHRKGEFTLRRASAQEAQARKRKIAHPVPGVPLPGE